MRNGKDKSRVARTETDRIGTYLLNSLMYEGRLSVSLPSHTFSALTAPSLPLLFFSLRLLWFIFPDRCPRQPDSCVHGATGQVCLMVAAGFHRYDCAEGRGWQRR